MGAKKLREAGYTCDALKDGRYSAEECKAAGYSLDELLTAKFPATDLRGLFSFKQLKSKVGLGFLKVAFSLKELRAEGMCVWVCVRARACVFQLDRKQTGSELMEMDLSAVRTNTHIHAHTHTHTHTHTCTHMHTHAHTRTRAHTHSSTRNRQGRSSCGWTSAL